MNCNRILYRTQTGKLLVSPAEREYVESCVAFHLGLLKSKLENMHCRMILKRMPTNRI